MPDYADGQDILSKRPEPGRAINVASPPVVLPQANPQLDANAIIAAVIKGVTAQMPKFVAGQVSSSSVVTDDFDNSRSLDRLADAMTNSKNMESNVENLGKIKETKKDEKEIKNTIDLLSNLDD